MRCRIVLLSIVLFVSQTVFADSLKIRDFFVSMPDTILPVMEKRNRLDLLDMYDAIQYAGEDGDGNIDVSDRRLSFLYTLASHVEMVMFTHKTDTVLSLIHTFNTSVPLSVISFYSTEWQRIVDESLCPMPSLRNFVKKEYAKNDSIRLLENSIPLDSYIIEADTLGQSLWFKYTGNAFLSVEDSVRFLNWFTEQPVELRWNGKRFK